MLSGELPLEELVKRYAGAYDSDFEDNLPSDGCDAESSDSGTATDSDDVASDSSSSSDGAYMALSILNDIMHCSREETGQY